MGPEPIFKVKHGLGVDFWTETGDFSGHVPIIFRAFSGHFRTFPVIFWSFSGSFPDIFRTFSGHLLVNLLSDGPWRELQSLKVDTLRIPVGYFAFGYASSSGGSNDRRRAVTRQRVEAVESKIKQLARDFAAAEHAVCYGRMGVSVQRYGTLCQWLIQVINIVTGNLDVPGGSLFPEPAFDVSKSKGGHFNAWQSRVSGLPEFNGELPSAVLAEEILTPGDGQIKALFTSAGNPVLSTPNGRRLDQALEGLEFMVSVDLYINETTRHADVILPPTSSLEHDHYDITFNNFAVRNVTRYNEPVLPKPAGALHDWEIFVGLGQAFAQVMGTTARETMPPAQMVDIALKSGPHGDRLNLAELQKHPHGIDLGPLQPNLLRRLQTASKRIELAQPLMLEDLKRVFDELDTLQPKEGELRLIGRRHVRSNNSWMHNYQRLVKGKPRDQLLMHPQDLVERGLQDGQLVTVRSRVGAVQVKVSANDEVVKGVVSLPHGWGHNRGGTQMETAERNAGVSANDLTDERFFDPVTGNAAVNGVSVEVVAA